MDISSFMMNNDMAGLLITLAGQSILISLIGLAVLKVLSKRSAPVRSLVCSATMIALGLTLVISIGFYIKGISWSQATLPFVTEDNIKNSILLPPDQNTIASIEIRALPLKAPSQITVKKNITNPAPGISRHSAPFVFPEFPLSNTAVLIWLAGILFQMLRLGYGIIIVKKFRNSLQSCKNDNYDKMLQAVAGRFWKKRLPKLYSSPLIKSPVTIGILNPVVIIPQRLSSIITENEMKSILLHELAHIYHYDQVAGIFKRFVIAFHWWNPFVYLINRHHEETREEVSDNYVLDELQPKVYSQCLMDLTKKVCLISSYPTAVGMAGRRFNLRKRVEQILSKKRSIAMGTKLRLKITGFSICLVLTLGIAGLHARGSAVENDDAFRVSQKPLRAINSVTIIKEDQNLTPKNIPEPEAVDEADKLQSIPKSGTMPQKEFLVKQTQENEKPVMVMASVDTKAINKTKKLLDSTGVRQDVEPVIKKDEAKTIVLAQNKTAESKIKNIKKEIQISAVNLDKKITVKNISQTESKGSQQKQHKKSSDAARQEYYTADDYFSRGKTLLEEGEPDKAVSYFNRALELGKKSAEVYLFRGNAYAEIKKQEKAMDDYNKAIELNSDYADAYNNRGYIFFIKQEYKKAIKDFKKAVKIKPDFYYAYFNRGNTYTAQKKYRKAVSYYSKAIKINPEFISAYINRGFSHYIKNSYNKAISDYTKALELNEDADVYVLRGNAYSARKKHENAIDDYTKAIRLKPDLSIAYIQRGQEYEILNDYKKAIVDYSKAIETAPENYTGYLYRGNVYFRKKDYYMAISDYSKVIELEPDTIACSIAYEGRSEAYRLTNQDTKAANDLKMAAKMAPSSFSSQNFTGTSPEARRREEMNREMNRRDIFGNMSYDDRQRLFEYIKTEYKLPEEMTMQDYWPNSW